MLFGMDMGGLGDKDNHCFSLDASLINASFIADGERLLVVSLVITRFNTPSNSSFVKLVVEYFLKRRLTISNLESLLGSITH